MRVRPHRVRIRSVYGRPEAKTMAIALRFLSVAAFLFLLTSSAAASSGAKDLLKKFGFPKGLLPNSAKNYSLADDGSFQVRLKHPCYVQFTDLVYYDEIVTGRISYGSLSGIKGIQVKKLFVWFPISSIKADEDSNTIQINVGFLTETFPWKQFKDVPDCLKKLPLKASYRRDADFLSEEPFAAAAEV
ncbi:uncharacterized protein LOC122041919 [Zingiber officinale]|uniref:DUF538 family protein n=1 Tax=Zingiber officinale TaxID=94328 RepID=A0A8J5LKC2_ZINOF|nr:uncharacterized protein LOC122041919 [Zingiber officinale]KAG6528781.1 hypothetical protein ZIOFF_010966 [Zingiber officinale]